MTKQTYAPGTHPSLPAPTSTTGLIYWLRVNLFSSVANSIITLVSLYLLYLALPASINWLFLDATYIGETRKDCAPNGACLAFIGERLTSLYMVFTPSTCAGVLTLPLSYLPLPVQQSYGTTYLRANICCGLP